MGHVRKPQITDNMKSHVYIISIIAALSSAHAQSLDVPPWNATVKVVDDLGQPVDAAQITIGYYVAPPPGQTIATSSIKGETDTNGIFSSSGRTGSTDLFFGANKEGYYSAHSDYELAELKKNDTAKWNPTITLLLKKIGAPIPMYAKRLNTHVPALDKPVGFDLMAGDWIAPYGKGASTDVQFIGHFDKSANDSNFKLTVIFPNRGDGIQEFAPTPLEKTSALRSSQDAPADGYQPQWVQFDNRRAGKPVETNRDENRNYYFRVRTVLDEQGNVKSTLYGKIYGDFMSFSYYLNPTPNERNIEFDPKHNLMQGLKSFEQVTQP